MTEDPKLTQLSKFLSYILRHRPQSIGLSLDKNGWLSVSELIEQANKHGYQINRKILNRIIRESSKQRFILDYKGESIRAGYGHTIDVDLELNPKIPPDILYHGTAQASAKAIKREGINAGSRNFVHLSVEKEDARYVGSRHGKPVILKIEAKTMAEEGYNFYQSESEPGIWLTKEVPAKFITSL